MKMFILFTLCSLATIVTYSQEFVEIPVWPGGAAESNGITEPETEKDGRISNISTASMKIFPADKSKNTGIAILICPGGGYRIEAADHEGCLFASWYAAQGITAVVLKYRLPNKHHAIPLKDAQEAMRILRKEAGKWGINLQKIGISGFSAGGHLASTLLTHFDESCRPDFGVLFYPVISMKDSITHQGSRNNLIGEKDNRDLLRLYSSEEQVKKDTPPTLLLLSDDDETIVPENSTLFYNALKANKIPATMYIFPEGKHGWGFNKTFKYHEEMKRLLLDWIDGINEGIIPAQAEGHYNDKNMLQIERGMAYEIENHAQDVFPDGTPIPDWFRQNKPVELSALGKQYRITDYDVLNDSTKIQTRQIQAVIDLAHREGGGVVIIPEGTFLSGSLFFKQKTHLLIEIKQR